MRFEINNRPESPITSEKINNRRSSLTFMLSGFYHILLLSDLCAGSVTLQLLLLTVNGYKLFYCQQIMLHGINRAVQLNSQHSRFGAAVTWGIFRC